MTVTSAANGVTAAVNDSVDARPVVVAEPTSGSPPWLFWHSRRPDVTKRLPFSTRRQLWMKTFGGTDAPRPVMAGAPDDGPTIDFFDEWPTAVVDGSLVRLFWTSNRGGTYGLWTRTLDDGLPNDAEQLTDHPAGDYAPAVVNAGGTVWLFWQSSRRGPTDIWAKTLSGGKWSPPTRVTRGQPRDLMPAACVESVTPLRIHLFWSADLGDRSRIHHSVFDGTSWSVPADVSSPPLAAGGFDTTSRWRDEGPAAIPWNGALWLFWSSNRNGVFRLWSSSLSGGAWSPPAEVTQGRSAEKDPAVFVDATTALRLLFRTQRGGEIYRSRTFISPAAAAQLGETVEPSASLRGLVADRWHYTYSTNHTDPTDPSSYYSRDAVGLYIIPDDSMTRAPYEAEGERLSALVEPFRPLPVRFVQFLEPPNVTELVYGAKHDIGESYTDDYPDVDTLGAIGESASAATGWAVLRTNTFGSVSADPAHPATTLRNRTFFQGLT